MQVILALHWVLGIWLTFGFLIPSFPWKRHLDPYIYPPYLISLSSTPGNRLMLCSPNTWLYFIIHQAVLNGIHALEIEKEDKIKRLIKKWLWSTFKCWTMYKDTNRQNQKFPLNLAFVWGFTTTCFVYITGPECIFPIIPESSLVQKVLGSGLDRMLAWLHGSFTLKTEGENKWCEKMVSLFQLFQAYSSTEKIPRLKLEHKVHLWPD